MADALHPRSTMPHTWHTMPVALQMNGQLWRGDVRAEETLLELVRERLRLTGTKRSCESQVCGAYVQIIEAIQDVVEARQGDASGLPWPPQGDHTSADAAPGQSILE
jgi:aerobic-type carbon monoxide dehydrogenase small subunit (CoxS/CutS family)